MGFFELLKSWFLFNLIVAAVMFGVFSLFKLAGVLSGSGFSPWPGMVVMYNSFFFWLIWKQKKLSREAKPIHSNDPTQKQYAINPKDSPVAIELGGVLQVSQPFLDELGFESALWDSEFRKKSKIHETNRGGIAVLLLIGVLIAAFLIVKISAYLAAILAIIAVFGIIKLSSMHELEAALETDSEMIKTQEQKELVLKLLNYQLNWQRSHRPYDRILSIPMNVLKLRIIQIEAMRFDS